MRRDMEYCIELLKDIADDKVKRALVVNNRFDATVTDEEVEENKKYLEHMKMLQSGNLIKLNTAGSIGSRVNIIDANLNWAGHDFLDMTDDKTLWDKVKSGAKEKGFEVASMPLDILVEYTKAKASEILGL